jgi:hypothetical protein
MSDARLATRSTLRPRAVVVTRASEPEQLLARHATRAQAEYFLRSRGRAMADLDAAAARTDAAVRTVTAGIPPDWRRANVTREDLPVFAFAAEDIVIVVGPDVLVANVAKYLHGQPVFGVNPDPAANPGILVPLTAPDAARLLTASPQFRTLTMARAATDDGQQLTALNEIYFGHAGHQSARYVLSLDGRQVRQSSSGLIMATGTGATGWAASISRERHSTLRLPRPQDRELAWFAREPWPGPGLDADTNEGLITAELVITCASDELVLFADGIERDHIGVHFGQDVTVSCAQTQLHLAMPA